ncbi:MAG TPA: toxin C-terminal domain-containing protein, partial [Chitinophagaceae bacterium]|nr:toxin C-terminal domain-containing protein [Chitinophagaceae bacterium]
TPFTNADRVITNWPVDFNYRSYIPPYAQTATVYKSAMGIYVVGQTVNGTNYVTVVYEVPPKKEITRIDRLIFAQQQQMLLLSNSFKRWNVSIQTEEIITNDPHLLPDEYLDKVNRRLINGTATAQDQLYANEVAARKQRGSLNDPDKVSFIQGRGDKAKKVTVDVPVGYKKTNLKSHGQPVYKKGNSWITPDQDGHNGGIWKMFDNEKNIGSTDKNKRVGTYDANLNRIGD